MKTFFTDNELTLESGGMSLRGILPVLNSAPLRDAALTLSHRDENRIVLRFRAPALGGGALRVELTREGEQRTWLRFALENFPAQVALDSFGVRFTRLERLRAFLRSGYYSWDGGEYVSGDAEQAVTGYALTQLLPQQSNSNLVLGFERHDRFQHMFTFQREGETLSLDIQTWWDRKARGDGEPCESERLVILQHAGVEEALRAWARLVAAASFTPPRHAGRITGWCSWYNLYAYISEENILEHLESARQAQLWEENQTRSSAAPVFQIDDGFTPEMGDWLEVKPQFPRGMAPLLDDIRAARFIPGLWIAPFMVGNRSHLFRDHPDWVVRDRTTGGPLAQMRFYEEFRWHKRSEEYYILDTTHPEAFEYLRSVFRVWRREWGCEYFKTDFMHFGSEHGPARALWHAPGQTRIEIWRRVAQMIREEIGEALWLGCGCPLWAPIGLVDAVRIGRDVGARWEHAAVGGAARSLLRDLPARNFANGILWQADPDCILLRDRFHYLTGGEVQALALFAGLAGGVLITSDALDELSHERRRLWQFLLNLPAGVSRFPRLGDGGDLVLIEARDGETEQMLLVLNPGDVAVVCEYSLSELGFPAPRRVFDWTSGQAWNKPVDAVSFRLTPHQAILLLLRSP